MIFGGRGEGHVGDVYVWGGGGGGCACVCLVIVNGG